LQEMGNGKTRHASRFTSPYQQMRMEIQGQTTMRGVPPTGCHRRGLAASRMSVLMR
jgi:hypothetical protein